MRYHLPTCPKRYAAGNAGRNHKIDMKLRTIATLAALVLMAYSMTSCITTETTITDPDGTTTTTKTTAPAPGYDAAAVVLAGGVAGKIVADK